MTNLAKLSLVVLIGVGAFLVLRGAGPALSAALPSNMPANSQFLQSGYDVANNESQGNWVACTLHADEAADWCRITDQNGHVVYQGSYLPLGSSIPLPESELHIAAINPAKLWVTSPVHQVPVPVFPLVGGKVLVPAEDRYALAQRWQADPTEYDRLLPRGH